MRDPLLVGTALASMDVTVQDDAWTDLALTDLVQVTGEAMTAAHRAVSITLISDDPTNTIAMLLRASAAEPITSLPSVLPGAVLQLDVFGLGVKTIALRASGPNTAGRLIVTGMK